MCVCGFVERVFPPLFVTFTTKRERERKFSSNFYWGDDFDGCSFVQGVATPCRILR